jgi:hypothetical protein
MHLHTQLKKERNKYVVEIEKFHLKESAQEEKTCKGKGLYYSLSSLHTVVAFVYIHLLSTRQTLIVLCVGET